MVFAEEIDYDSISLDTFTVGDGDYEVFGLTVMSETSVGSLEEAPEKSDPIILYVENEEGDDLTGVAIVQNSAIRDLAGNEKDGIETEIAFEAFPR
jgi:hypothetical protein